MITIIQTTSDKKAELETLGQHLVKERLVACCQIDGPLSSTNHWEGDVEHTQEFRLTMKTTAAHVTAVLDYISAHHSYDLPELIYYEVNTTPGYQQWVEQETRS